jgi:hypothetical protein
MCGRVWALCWLATAHNPTPCHEVHHPSTTTAQQRRQYAGTHVGYSCCAAYSAAPPLSFPPQLPPLAEPDEGTHDTLPPSGMAEHLRSIRPGDKISFEYAQRMAGTHSRILFAIHGCAPNSTKVIHVITAACGVDVNPPAATAAPPPPHAAPRRILAHQPAAVRYRAAHRGCGSRADDGGAGQDARVWRADANNRGLPKHSTHQGALLWEGRRVVGDREGPDKDEEESSPPISARLMQPQWGRLGGQGGRAGRRSTEARRAHGILLPVPLLPTRVGQTPSCPSPPDNPPTSFPHWPMSARPTPTCPAYSDTPPLPPSGHGRRRTPSFPSSKPSSKRVRTSGMSERGRAQP